jgi:hypothetical protein
MPYGAAKCGYSDCGRYEPEDDVQLVRCQYCGMIYYACFTCRKNGCAFCSSGKRDPTKLRILLEMPNTRGAATIIASLKERTDFTEFWVPQYRSKGHG